MTAPLPIRPLKYFVGVSAAVICKASKATRFMFLLKTSEAAIEASSNDLPSFNKRSKVIPASIALSIGLDNAAPVTPPATAVPIAPAPAVAATALPPYAPPIAIGSRDIMNGTVVPTLECHQSGLAN